MKGYMRLLVLVLGMLIISKGILAYTVSTNYNTVSIDYTELNNAEVVVYLNNSYLSFYIYLKNTPPGNYTLEIPEDKLSTLLCAPTYFKLSTTKNVKITCIAKPVSTVVQVNLVRVYNNTTKTNSFSVILKNNAIWYKTFSGGVPKGYILTNNIYSIELKPKDIIAFVKVYKNGELVWSGIMFPGMDENVTKDLSIKFYGSYDNTSFLTIYSTISNKFNMIPKQQTVTKIVKVIQPVCKLINNTSIMIKNTIATVYYVDGNKTDIDATNKTIYLYKRDIAKVICGKVLEFKPVKPLNTYTISPSTEKTTFIIPPKSTYYVGETVHISATVPFEIQCINVPSSFKGIKEFSYIFDKPTTCTLKLGDKLYTFRVINKTTTTATTTTKKSTSYELNIQQIVVLLGILSIIVLYLTGYLDKLVEKLKGKTTIFSRTGKNKETKEEKEVEYQIKNILEE